MFSPSGGSVGIGFALVRLWLGFHCPEWSFSSLGKIDQHGLNANDPARPAAHNVHVASRPAALMRLKSGDKMRFVAVPFDPA